MLNFHDTNGDSRSQELEWNVLATRVKDECATMTERCTTTLARDAVLRGCGMGSLGAVKTSLGRLRNNANKCL